MAAELNQFGQKKCKNVLVSVGWGCGQGGGCDDEKHMFLLTKFETCDGWISQRSKTGLCWECVGVSVCFFNSKQQTKIQLRAWCSAASIDVSG